MDLDFLANFAVSNSEDEFSSSKEEILKVLKRIGVDTRFVSYFEDEEGSIKLYIENLRFSKFSRNRTSVFNKHYPDIEVVRSTLFQKICARSSKTLADSLNPRDKLLLPPMENDYSRLLYIVLEPYSRKYGIEFIEHDNNICLDEVDSIISPLNLNQEVNHILNDIFDGKGIEWDQKYKDAFDMHGLNDKKVVFPFINVPEEWINDFLGIEREYAVDYENDDIGESFMGFLSGINSQFKENVLATSTFLEEKHK